MRDNLAEIEPGNARVRLINATPDVDDLDLYIAGTKTRVQHGMDASVGTSFTDVAPGMLEIRPANKPAPPQLSNLKVEEIACTRSLSRGRRALWIWFELRIGSSPRTPGSRHLPDPFVSIPWSPPRGGD